MDTYNLSWQSITRSYLVHQPANYQAGNGAVFVLHGGGGDGNQAAATSDMAVEADLYGFLAVFPYGEGKWNDGRENVDANKDDIGFLREVIKDLGVQLGADNRRMGLCGMSNGGLMTQRLARQQPGMFAAYASTVANIAADIASTAALEAVPMLMFNGTDDTLMPWNGGVIPGSGELGGGTVTSTMTVVDAWAAKNEAAFYVEGMLPDYDGTDDCQAYRRDYIGGKKIFTFFRIENGGHGWPGSDEVSAPIAGNKNMDISATKIISQFFRAHGV